MPQYKLTYFNGKGRAEPVRLLLAHAKVDYEDDRIEGAQWPAIKASTPYGQMPVLREGDFVLSQSMAILKYVGIKHGYGGSNEQEAARIDEISGAISDVATAFYAARSESDPDKKAKLEKVAATEKGPFYLKKFEEIVNKNGGYLVGGKPTYADFFLANFNDGLATSNPELLEAYPGLKKHRDSILNAPGVKEYVAKRPVTPF